MKTKLTGVYVDDQQQALRFYTDVLGFTRKADLSRGPFPRQTVALCEAPNAPVPRLALNDNPTERLGKEANR